MRKRGADTVVAVVALAWAAGAAVVVEHAVVAASAEAEEEQSAAGPRGWVEAVAWPLPRAPGRATPLRTPAPDRAAPLPTCRAVAHVSSKAASLEAANASSRAVAATGVAA